MQSEAELGATPIIGICGWKKSGKTTLTVRLVEEFTRRGLKVATLKHAHHSFQIDDDDTDSARHRRAGAGEVAVVSNQRWAMIGELQGRDEPDFADVIAWFAPCDLIIVEGYKTAPIPKIEARRVQSVTKTTLAGADQQIIAIAADHDADGKGLPVFQLDDIAMIADFIAKSIGAKSIGAKSIGAKQIETVDARRDPAELKSTGGAAATTKTLDKTT